MKIKTALTASFLAGLSFANSHGIQLITNGDFETGTSAGWTILDLPNSSGTTFIDTPGSTTPLSLLTTQGTAANGNWYAVTDMTGGGTHVLLQSFTVPLGATQVVVSFDLFVNDYDSGPIINPAGLDHLAGNNQHARVDILTAGAGAFSTAGADVISNLYIGVDGGADPNPFTTYSVDITGAIIPGNTYQFRLGEVDNQLFLNAGIDNVSIEATVAAAVPEGGLTLGFLGLAFAGLAGLRRKS